MLVIAVELGTAGKEDDAILEYSDRILSSWIEGVLFEPDYVAVLVQLGECSAALTGVFHTARPRQEQVPIGDFLSLPASLWVERQVGKFFIKSGLSSSTVGAQSPEGKEEESVFHKPEVEKRQHGPSARAAAG